MENGVTLIMVVFYVPPNQKIIDIQEFMHIALLKYSKDVSGTLSRYNKNLHGIPLILAGDFYINSSDKYSELLTQFLWDEFDLRMNNDLSQYNIDYIFIILIIHNKMFIFVTFLKKS